MAENEAILDKEENVKASKETAKQQLPLDPQQLKTKKGKNKNAVLRKSKSTTELPKNSKENATLLHSQSFCENTSHKSVGSQWSIPENDGEIADQTDQASANISDSLDSIDARLTGENKAEQTISISSATTVKTDSVTTPTTTSKSGDSVSTPTTTSKSGDGVSDGVSTPTTTSKSGDSVSTPTTTSKSGDGVSTPTTTSKLGDGVSTPRTTSKSGDIVSTPTTTSKLDDGVSTSTTTSKSGDGVSTPTTTSKSGDGVSTPTTTSKSGDGVSTPTTTSKLGDGVSTPTSISKSDDGVTTPTTTSKSGDGVSTPTTSKSVDGITTPTTTSKSDDGVSTPTTTSKSVDGVTTPTTTSKSDDGVSTPTTTSKSDENHSTKQSFITVSPVSTASLQTVSPEKPPPPSSSQLSSSPSLPSSSVSSSPNEPLTFVTSTSSISSETTTITTTTTTPITTSPPAAANARSKPVRRSALQVSIIDATSSREHTSHLNDLGSLGRQSDRAESLTDNLSPPEVDCSMFPTTSSRNSSTLSSRSSTETSEQSTVFSNNVRPSSIPTATISPNCRSDSSLTREGRRDIVLLHAEADTELAHIYRDHLTDEIGTGFQNFTADLFSEIDSGRTVMRSLEQLHEKYRNILVLGTQNLADDSFARFLEENILSKGIKDGKGKQNRVIPIWVTNDCKELIFELRIINGFDYFHFLSDRTSSCAKGYIKCVKRSVEQGRKKFK